MGHMTLIRYRTRMTGHPSFVVIPDMFVSSIVRWLSDQECATIEYTEQTDKEFHAPERWPDYRMCEQHTYLLDLCLGDR
jgi:hypothetical protein